MAWERASRMGIVAVIISTCSLGMAQTSQPADRLRPLMGFSGSQVGDERVQNARNQRERPARLLVLERNGENFKAFYVVQLPAGNHSLELEAVVRNNQIVLKPIRIINGPNWENGILERPWKGQIQGDDLMLERVTDRQLKITSTLKYDPNVTQQNIRGRSNAVAPPPRRGRGQPSP